MTADHAPQPTTTPEDTMTAPDRACPDYPNECVHPWAHARTYAEVKASQPAAAPYDAGDAAPPHRPAFATYLAASDRVRLDTENARLTAELERVTAERDENRRLLIATAAALGMNGHDRWAAIPDTAAGLQAERLRLGLILQARDQQRDEARAELGRVRQHAESLKDDLAAAGDVIAAARAVTDSDRLSRRALTDLADAIAHYDTPPTTRPPSPGSADGRAQDTAQPAQSAAQPPARHGGGDGQDDTPEAHKVAEAVEPDAWIVPKIAHDQNRLVGPRVHGRWIYRAAGQSDPDHARRYAAELLAAADEAEQAEG